MKVTFCAYDRPDYVGGPNAGLIRLLPALKKGGVNVCCLFLVFAPHCHCPTIRSLEAAGISCRSHRYHPTTELRVRWLLRQLKENPPDIFVPNLMPAAYFAAPWCRKAGIPTIGVIRNVDAFHEGFLEEFAFGKKAFRQTAFVGVSTEAVRMIQKKTVPLAAVEQIPSPVIRPDRRIFYNGGAFRVVYSGRIVEKQKRVVRTAKAFCRSAEQVPETTYTMIGDGPEAERVRSVLNTLPLKLPVRMLGRVNPPDMPDELKRHHCIVLLSDYEGLPLALMEAMAHGLIPIGLKQCKGVAELIKHRKNGLLIQNPEKDLPEAIASLKNDPALFEQLSKASRECIKTISELHFVVEKWLTLFEKIRDAEGPRCPIRIPIRLNLPPCNPKVASEDDRANPLGQVYALGTSLFPSFIHGKKKARFLAPQCHPETIDIYSIRRAILQALKTALPQFNGMVVDVGAGIAPYKQLILEAPGVSRYLAFDLAGSAYAPPDVLWDGYRLPLADNSVETVMATEVLEHCPSPELLLKECQRILKSNGLFFATVPFLWPLHDVPHDHWRYTPWSLERLMENEGFSQIKIVPIGGYEASLAQMLGLWVRRRSRNKTYQRLIRPMLSILLAPLVWGLTKMDNPTHDFREGSMVTGFAITARKRDSV